VGRRTAILCADVAGQTPGPEVVEQVEGVKSEPAVQQGHIVREVGLGLVGFVLAALLVVAPMTTLRFFFSSLYFSFNFSGERV